ncbi:MAG TPA: RNA-directed DNA polymerase, partial [Blastocatellia bacterium]|nr:RNA-directed DNA polymerase [Blastocatellia bacterium]
AVYEVGETVERARISPSEGIVHSFRFAPTPHGVLWDRSASYNSFRQRSVELAESPGVAVVAETDIANFYHSIPADAIANSLERVGVDARRAQGFYGLLCSFFRTGLPVGPSCSALLAESVLIATDEQLLRRGCRFVRFNDDYKLFGRTEAEVRGHLRSLADALWQTARLDLNASKTRISETEQFAKDTKRERDNWLSRLAALFAQDDPYGTTESSVAFTPGLSSLVQSAKALLLNAIDEQHPAWTRLYRQAFGALPPTQRLEMVPRLLPELARVWDLAPKIALSLRAAPTVGTERRSQVFAAVLSGLAPQSAETEGVPPYAAMWVLSGMGRNGWYDGPELLKLGGCFPQDSPAQRELLLALSGRDDLGQIRFSRADPWHRRAYEWASGAAISYPQLMSDNGPPSPWHKLLERLITESGARELAIGDF